MSGIERWLEAHGLEKYADLFVENEIDLEVLPELEEADLKDLDVPLGARKKILKAIREFEFSEAISSSTETAENSKTLPGGEAERRQLTVMFCDLVGSTAFSESMDTEDYRELLSAYQNAAASVIHEYEGYIARYMGDGLLVYFGYPTAQENDPERAARAGLAIIDAVSSVNSEIPLEVRVGVATGPVVVGDIVGEGASEEAAVLGETPNLAARLQGTALPNTVLLSPTTQQLLHGRVETEALEPVELKGLSRLIVPHRAVRPRPLSEVSETQLDSTPLIGRDIEVALLERAWRNAQSGEGQAVLLSGEAGVGKSRLLRAFQNAIQEDERTRVQWHCSPYYQTTANYPAIEQLKHSVQLDGSGVDHTLDAIAAMVNRLGLESAELVPALGLLLSVPTESQYATPEWTPDELKRRLMQVQVNLLVAAARQAPVLFIIEDLHWADPTTLAVLGEMIAAIREERVLMLMTARPEYNPPWTDQSHATTQLLCSLSRNETIALVQGIAEEHGFSSDVVEQIVRRTDGVPLFVEELTKSLLESTGEAGVPASLQDSLMARLDRLGPTKELAQIASVIGRSFSLDDLASLTDRGRDVVEQGLGQLVDTGLAHRRAGGEYEFKHALIRDTAYDSMLRNTRLELHGRFADYLSEIGQQHEELLAQHYELAGKWDEAFNLWKIAGRRSLNRSAGEESVSHFGKAMECLSHLPDALASTEATIDANIELGWAWQIFEGRGAGLEAFETAVSLCEASGDLERKARALSGVCQGLYSTAPAKGLLVSEELRGLAVELNDQSTETEALVTLSTAHYLLGNFTDALVEGEKGLKILQTVASDQVAGSMVGHPAESLSRTIGMSCDALGLRDQASKAMARAREVATATKRPFIYCISRIYSAKLMTWQGRYDEAYDFASAALKVAEEAKLGIWIAASKLFLGRALVERGHASEGPALMKEGIALWVNRAWLGEWHSHLAEALLKLGRTDEAAEALAKAGSFMEQVGAMHYASERYRLMALLAKLRGAERGEIETALVTALAVARKQQARSFELNAALDLARLWQEQADAERARDLLQPIYSRFDEGFDTPSLKDAKALLDQLT